MMKNFLINLSVIAAFAGSIAYFASKKFPQIDFSLITYLCFYFFFITAASYYVILKSVSKQTNNSKFVSSFLLTTVAKFLISILILMGYVLLNPGSAVSFIILFASCYFIFTSFEVVSLIQLFKTNK